MSGADPSWISIAFLVFGSSIWFGCFLAAMRRCRGVELPVLLSLAKLLLVATDVFRIYLCFLALGEAAHFAQAAAFAVAAVLGSAVSVVPAGLGVREAVSAGLAPLVGLAPALGFLAASLNRLLDLVTVLPIACGLLVFARLQSRDCLSYLGHQISQQPQDSWRGRSHTARSNLHVLDERERRSHSR